MNPAITIQDVTTQFGDFTAVDDILLSIEVKENERGTTVFLSSHILGQVEPVCDRVSILDSGQTVAKDSIEGLRQQIETDSTLTIRASESLNSTEEFVAERPGVVVRTDHRLNRLRSEREATPRDGQFGEGPA